MYIDVLISPLPPGTPQSMVAGGGVNIQIGNVIDLLGLGVGVTTTTANQIIGTPAVWGTDFGIGTAKMQIEVVIGTTFTTSNSSTLDVYFQGAIDNGSAQPGTWNTFVTTGPIAVASLTNNAIIARFDYPPAFPANLQPRFIRLLGVVPAATNFTAGTISYAIVVPARDDTAEQYAARNYVAR